MGICHSEENSVRPPTPSPSVPTVLKPTSNPSSILKISDVRSQISNVSHAIVKHESADVQSNPNSGVNSGVNSPVISPTPPLPYLPYPYPDLNPEHKQFLDKHNFKDLKDYTNDGKIMYGKVVSVYDGDTVRVVIIGRNGKEERYKFRMYGYDTPEIRPLRSEPFRDAHKTAAQIAKDQLSNIILDRTVIIKFHEEEKYGRQMGDLYPGLPLENSVNDRMIEMGLAKKYFGKTKTKWTREDLEGIIKRYAP